MTTAAKTRRFANQIALNLVAVAAVTAIFAFKTIDNVRIAAAEEAGVAVASAR